MEIYLIRHTSVNCEKGICYGMSDVDITETFIQEAKVVQEKLLDENIELFYTSPLQRCLKLTKFLTNKQFFSDNRIKELNFGEWELKSWNIIDKSESFKDWSLSYVNIRCPNGESFLDLDNRVNDFYEEITQQGHDKIGIVAHGGVIRSILCSTLKIPIEHSYTIGLDYGGVSKIEINTHSTTVKYINR